MIARASRTLFVLGLASLLLSPAARAQDLQDLLDSGNEWLQQVAPEDLLKDLQPPTQDELRSFWKSVGDALQSQDLDDLSWMEPAVAMAVQYLQSQPATKPYADWLQQRADFFDMARLVVRQLPGPTPEQPSPTGTIRLLPPPRPKSAPIPPAVVRRRLDTVRSRQVWKQKLATRPAPASAQALVPTLKNVFRDEGVPPAWVWIAEVESSMNPLAANPVGARGLFQFMPATAQRFGLKIEPDDERLAPDRSARAAAKYLKVLHSQFGSWPLVIAAYNAGEGRVAKALKGSSTKTFEGIEDSLPLETQMYVPKVLATVSLRENVDPVKLPAPTAMAMPLGLDVVAWVFRFE